MIQYDEWERVYKDFDMDVRKDPQELEGYGLNIIGTENYLLIPRGTLKEIAQTNRYNGKSILINLLPVGLPEKEFFKGTSLTFDSLIAAIGKAYLTEQ